MNWKDCCTLFSLAMGDHETKGCKVDVAKHCRWENTRGQDIYLYVKIILVLCSVSFLKDPSHIYIYIHSLRKVLSTRVSQGECLAASTLHPWIVSLSQKTILGVSFLCCHNFSEENNVQQSFQFTTERNVRRFYF